MTRVRVGIVSWNTAGLLERCLSSLPAALGALDAQVVVVDNASSDDSVEVARSHPDVHVTVNSENVGYARGMNQALTGDDECEVLIALNPDTEPPPGSLQTLVERLLAGPDIGLVTPRLTYPNGALQHSAYRFPSPTVAAAVSFLPHWWLRRGTGQRLWLEGYSPHDRSVDVDWAVGAVHVMRSAALPDRHLPYSERWFMYVEDLDLCWRLAQGGWRRRLEADVVIPHVANAAGSQAWADRRTLVWLAATYEWYELAKGSLATRIWAAANLVGSAATALRSAVRALFSPRGSRRRSADIAREMVMLMPLHALALVAGAEPVRRRVGAVVRLGEPTA